MSGEKIGFLLGGALFLCVTRILYVKRRWFARMTVDAMSFVKDTAERDREVRRTDVIFKILLGYLAPAFAVIWLLVVALS